MSRHLSLVAGLILLCAVWSGPLPELAKTNFAGHTILHMAVVSVAAPLISAWLAGSKAIMHRIAQSTLSPIPAAVFEFVVVWGWHTPMLHELAGFSNVAFVAAQASFLLAGILLWTSALAPPTAAGGSSGAGVLALFLTSMHMILLGTLLTLAPRPLYTHAIQSVGDIYAQLAEQRVGGILMLIGGGLPYLVGGLFLVNRLLREPASLHVVVRHPPSGELQ